MFSATVWTGRLIYQVCISMPMDGLVVLSTYLALAGVKESRRGGIRQLKPNHLFKITSLTTFIEKKSDAKKLIYAPALVSGNYHIVC